MFYDFYELYIFPVFSEKKLYLHGYIVKPIILFPTPKTFKSLRSIRSTQRSVIYTTVDMRGIHNNKLSHYVSKSHAVKCPNMDNGCVTQARRYRLSVSIAFLVLTIGVLFRYNFIEQRKRTQFTLQRVVSFLSPS
uniref:Uncharacterized protein n=1 Tax=Schizaphis graminum TaxID=13262 RepID=A0A2S2NZ96_SCHGA